MSETPNEIRNATIDSTMLGIEDHGIMSAHIGLDYGDCHQGFGGFALDGKPNGRTVDSKREPSACCGHFIARILQIAGVGSWEKLKGRSIRIKREDGWNGRIVAVGHLLKEDWFDPEAEFKAMEF